MPLEIRKQLNAHDRLRIFADGLLMRRRHVKAQDSTLEVNGSSEYNAPTASAIKSEGTGGSAKLEVEWARSPVA